MTQRISSYLDTLWGAETVPWSMYYLNGRDNSMILVSTLPLKDLSSGFKETTVGSIVDSRRAEMLQQANAPTSAKVSPPCVGWPAKRALFYLAHHL